MKKHFYFLFSALLIVLFSCSNDTPSPENLKKQMVDKWNARIAYQYNFTAAGKVIDSVRIQSIVNSDILEYKEDGTYTYKKVSGTVTRSGTFNVTSNTAFTMKEEGVTYNCTVRSLNFNSFVYTAAGPRVTAQPYSITKYYFDR